MDQEQGATGQGSSRRGLPDLDDFGVDAAQARRDWESLPGLRAVATGRVYLLEGRHLVTPGPRFPQIIDDLSAVLHPDAGEGQR